MATACVTPALQSYTVTNPGPGIPTTYCVVGVAIANCTDKVPNFQQLEKFAQNPDEICVQIEGPQQDNGCAADRVPLRNQEPSVVCVLGSALVSSSIPGAPVQGTPTPDPASNTPQSSPVASVTANVSTRPGAPFTPSPNGTQILGTAANTPTVTPDLDSSGSDGLSGGAIAGIVVGALAILAIIVGMAFVVLRRRKRRGQPIASRYTYDVPADEKHLGGAKSGVVASNIPLPAEDPAITAAMSKVRDDIKNHIQNYYHQEPATMPASWSSEVQTFCSEVEVDAHAFWDALLASETRLSALRTYLSWVVFSRLGGQGNGGASLLPPGLAQINAAVMAPDCSPTEAISRKTEGANSNGKIGRQEGDIKGATLAAEAILRIFAGGDSHRTKNLERVVRQAAEFGTFLFSQPSLWKFDWSKVAGDAGHLSLVVTPALLQVVDEQARVLKPPKVFFDREAS